LRKFSYNGLGFMTSETHPELGPGTVNHGNIDALGHPHLLEYPADRKQNALFEYDRAERLLDVSSMTPGSPASAPVTGDPLTQVRYQPENGPVGTRGKVSTAYRQNTIPAPFMAGMSTTVDITKEYVYDYAGRPTSQKLSTHYGGGFNVTTGYAYDALGQLSRINYPTLVPNGGGVANQVPRSVFETYARGRLTGIGNGATGAARTYYASLGYFSNGMLSMITRQRGARSLSDTILADTVRMKRPGGFTWDYVNPTPITASTGTYSYDGAGNIDAIGDGLGVDSYRYDDTYRLAKATIDGVSRSYAYDAFGNRTDGFATADPNTNRLTGVCATPCYDALGNLLILPDRRPVAANAPPPPPLKFKYDLLSSMTNFDAAQIGRSFIYDADGERVATFDYKTADNTLHELWSMRGVDKHVLRDFDRSGTAYTWSAVKDYVYRGSLLSSTVLPGEALRDVHVDHLGSTRLITDATGAPIVVARVPAYDSHGDPILDAQHNQVYNDIKDAPRKYWPFGELKVIRPLGDRMAFTGHERDDDGSANGAAALDYMHARYYTATLGRFVSTDPVLNVASAIGAPQAWNRYTYVRNSPLSSVDPDGKDLQFSACASNTSAPACKQQFDEYLATFGDKAKDASKYLSVGKGGLLVLAGISRRQFGAEFGIMGKATGYLVSNHAVTFSMVGHENMVAKTHGGGFCDCYGPDATFTLGTTGQAVATAGVIASPTEVLVHELGHAIAALGPGHAFLVQQSLGRSMFMLGDLNGEAYATAFENAWRHQVLGVSSVRGYVMEGDMLDSTEADLFPPRRSTPHQ
jgi:RHS repeat-associated protein